MRAVMMERNGGPEVLVVRDLPDPEPAKGELVVELAAAGVNFRDILERRGGHGSEPPAIVGFEGAGTVAAIGPEVTEFAVGDRVCWDRVLGSYTELAVVPEAFAIPIPDAVDAEAAAASVLQGMTAHFMCRSVVEVGEGDVVVVHAAAGGVGHLLTQMIAERGGVVVATASSPEKREAAVTAGARVAVAYDEVREAVLEQSDGEGAMAVFDGVGADTFDSGLECLRPTGILVCFGWASGPPPPLDTQRLREGGSLLYTRASMHDYTRTREDLLWRGRDVLEAVGDGSLRVHTVERFPFEEADRAQARMESRSTKGKLLIVPSTERGSDV